jgi:NADH-quinone oxidoreductase subunit L
MIFIVFEGEPSPYVREHFHRTEGGAEGPPSMTWVVAVLAVLAAFAGWIQVPALWDPISTFLDPVAEPLVTPSETQELIASLIAVGVALAGIAVARLLYGPNAVRFPSVRPLRQVLERKFYADEAYDLVFYRPAALLAQFFVRFVERWVIAGSLRGLGFATRGAGAGVGEAQTGLVRTYALVLAGAVAVLIFVFVAVR